jgi:hypothetical protein
MDNEISELRRWRHDLEGMGIMGIPERVKELEEARHQEALKNVEFRLTIQTLKEGMSELSTTIKAFHGDLATIRKLFVVCIILVTFSILLPTEVITSLIQLVLKVL